jgi:cytochrome P450
VTEDRLFGADLVDDPYPFFDRIRDTPVWKLPGENAFLVSSWDLVAEATARPSEFSNNFRYLLFSHDDGALGVLTGVEPVGPDVFASADPPAHTAHRRAFLPELMPKRMQALEQYVSDLADEMLDALLAERSGDAATGLAHPLPMRVIAERVIGFRDPDVAEIQRWVFEGSRIMGGRLTLEEMASVGALVSPMQTWVTAQLDDALVSSRRDDDVLDAAARGVRSGVLTREEAAFTLMVLVGAGAETTTTLLGNLMGILARDEELQTQLRANPRLLPAFVEEVLRFESPFTFHPRTTHRAVDLAGIEIPEGALVMLLWAAANRDVSVFDRPHEIRLDRPNAHLHFGFGRGIHHCIGAPLARLEARVVLAKLLGRTRAFELDPDGIASRQDNIWIRRHATLPIRFEPL